MNELQLLGAISALTALMWMPYVLERIIQQGLITTVGYPETPAAQSAWAARAQKAHANAVENLAVFAALLLAVVGLELQNGITLLAAQLYVAARIGHYFCYLLAIPWLRTLAFFGGFVAQAMLAWVFLG